MIIKDRDLLSSYAARHRRCEMCGASPDSFWPYGLEIHHIVGGTRGRSDEVTNLIALCSCCHRVIHGDRISWVPGVPSTGLRPRLFRANALWVKQLDGELDMDRLAEIAMGEMPQPEPPHEGYMEMRKFYGLEVQ